MYDDREIGIIGTSLGTDGQPIVARMARDGCTVTQAGHAHYQEATLRGNVFVAATPASTALLVGGLGTNTGAFNGFILYNPIGSGKNAVIWNIAPVVLGTSTAAALNVIALVAGTTTNIGAPTGSSTIGVRNAIIAPAINNVCIAYTTATFTVGCSYLVFLQQFAVSTAATTLVTTPIIDVLDGALILPPGQYIAIANGVGGGAQSMMISMKWEEIPI